jgi:hypothetical protein
MSDPDLDFLLIPDPGVKKAADPGSGSAALLVRMNLHSVICHSHYLGSSTGGGGHQLSAIPSTPRGEPKRF